jgi:hypothetical protein
VQPAGPQTLRKQGACARSERQEHARARGQIAQAFDKTFLPAVRGHERHLAALALDGLRGAFPDCRDLGAQIGWKQSGWQAACEEATAV